MPYEPTELPWAFSKEVSGHDQPPGSPWDSGVNGAQTSIHQREIDGVRYHFSCVNTPGKVDSR